MAKSIEPKLRKIGAYLELEEDTIFTIPEYQRPYSWSVNNCDKLWQDITDFMNSEFYDKKQFMENCIFECLRGIIKDYIFNGKEHDKLCPYSFKPCILR